MTEREALKLALDKKAENARELGLDYEPENTLHWHALNYRTAPTQNAQKMFAALEKFVEDAIKDALAQPEQEPTRSQKMRDAGHTRRPKGWDKESDEPEPVAYFNPQVKGGFYWAKPTKITAPVTVNVEPMPLYTTPPQRKPLPKGEWPKHPSGYVGDVYKGYDKSDLDNYAMQVLAAHGIKE